MKDLSEQELDKFFQKSLEKRQTPFNPKAWEKMEAKLEADKKKRLLYKRLLPLLLLLLITLGSGGTYFFSQNKYQEQAKNRQQTGTKGEQKIIKKEQQPTISNQQEIKETNNGVAETPFSNEGRDINNQLFLNQQEKNKSNELPDSKMHNESGGKFDLQKAQKATLQTASDGGTKNEQTDNKPKLMLITDSIEIADKSILVSKLDSFKRIEINQVKPEIIVVPKTNLPFGRLNIGMSVSPDWSSVRFQNINQTGYKLGLDIDYQFSKRISISTGIIFSRLFYNTNKDEYTVPKGFWTYQIRPEKVWGVCDALEIPINLRYNLFNGDRQRVFISTGISSYMLLSEDYSFEYAANMPSTLVKGWSGRTKSMYYFGIANFSLGYAGRLSPRSFWQVEPFVKLPLGSIGWGKVDLSSTGVFFSWKYILVK